MLDLDVSKFTEFVNSDLDADIKQVETAIEGIEFNSRKHGFKALCVLLRITTKQELDDASIIINTVLKRRGMGKEA